ncbi:MAG: hypothetical protein ABSE82_07390 [Nitrososphaerales archaeon]
MSEMDMPPTDPSMQSAGAMPSIGMGGGVPSPSPAPTDDSILAALGNDLQDGPPEESDPSYLDYIIPANFTEEEEAEELRIEKQQLSQIKQEYAKEKWLDRCDANDDEYEGVHDEDDDDSDIKLLLGTITIDIIASRAYRQTWTPNPFISMDAEFSDKNLADILSKRQDLLDFIARNKSDHKAISLPVYRETGKHGVAIVASFLDHDEELRTTNEVYRPGNQDDIKKFADKNKDKLLDPDSKEFNQHQQLTANQGKPIGKKETKKEVIYHGPKCELVNPEDFFARPSIKDFRKHIMISRIFTYNWTEIENKVSTGVWDIKKAVDEIKAENGDNYWEKDYKFYVSVVQFDRKKNGKIERFLVTREAVTNKMVRAIYYPYKRMCYHPFNVFERHDSWIGYSILDRMEDLIVSANAAITSFMAEQDLAHTPIWATNGKRAGDWTIKLQQPNLLQVDPAGMNQNTAITQYRMESPSTDRIQFLGWLMQYCIMLTGVDPQLLSGMGSPNDKRAAKEKVAMNFQASTIRIEDMIITLQKGDASLAAETEDMIYRFPEDPAKTDFSYTNKGNTETIDRAFFDRKVQYTCAGSSMAFDRQKDLQIIMQTIDFLAKFAPEITKDLDAKKALLTSVLNNSQGTIEKMKDILLAPIEKLVEMQRMLEEQENQKLQKVVAEKSAELKAQGMPDDQIKEKMRAFLMFLRQQNQKPAQPPQPAMPPQGAPQPPPPGARPQPVMAGRR